MLSFSDVRVSLVLIRDLIGSAAVSVSSPAEFVMMLSAR